MTRTDHTAVDAAAQLASGATSAVELTQFYLDRISSLNPSLNAVIALAPDALASAAASDARRAGGTTLGPLDGIPLLIKDNIEATGLPCTAGSRALLASPPTSDADLVRRIRAAGLVIIGCTNLSEWANFRSAESTSGWSGVGGQTRNPWDSARNTSGSSSGSAAAIAAGLAPLAIGTETDGSIVSPAGVCGLVGFKPTRGSVPGRGIVPISSRQDVAGPMARSVADCAALYAVISGRPADRTPFALAGQRIAVWRPDGLTDDVAVVLDAVQAALAAAGAEPETAAAAVSGPFEDAEFDALVAEFAEELPAYLAARPGPHPRTWAELLAFNRADDLELSTFGDDIFSLAADALVAGGTGSASYLGARAACDARAAEQLALVLGDRDFAVTVTNSPAWPISYDGGDSYGILTSSLCAVTGAPSVTLPAGLVGGLPVGISLLGRVGQDERLLALAAAVEALLPPVDYPLD